MGNSERSGELTTYPQPVLGVGWRGIVIVEKRFAPGVIWGGGVCRRLALQGSIKILGVDNVGKVFLFVENGEIEGFAFVEDGDGTRSILADGDLGIAQGVGGAVGLDLVNNLFELEGQVFREGAGFLPGQDMSQVFKSCERAMNVLEVAGGNVKAPVEIGNELRQIQIALLHGRDALQAQFFHQAVL